MAEPIPPRQISGRGSRWKCADGGCQLFIDGSPVLEYAGIPAAAGQIGLRTLESAGRFRNIKVTDRQGKILFEGLPKLARSSCP
jgi:hypothetical protein